MEKETQVPTEQPTPRKKNTLKDYFALGEVGRYFFRSHKTNNFNLKMMHGINKISIVMFLIGVIVLIARRIF